MKKLLFLAIFFSGLVQKGISQDPPQEVKSQIAADVKWIAKDAGNAPPSQVICSGFIVPVADGITGARMLAGAEDCLRIAVMFSLLNDKEKAITWLCAAQCHNTDAQSRFRAYPDFALSQALGRYKGHILKQPDAVIDALPYSELYKLIREMIE